MQLLAILLLQLLFPVVFTTHEFFGGHIHEIPSFLKQPKPSTARGNLGRTLSGRSSSLDNTIELADNLGPNKRTLDHEANAEFWLNSAHDEVRKRANRSRGGFKKAKNIIMFLGDGMSYANVVAARIRKGQLKGNTGEEDFLSFEEFPHVGVSKTYCVNAQVPDSACTATAFLCGVKANMITLGVNAKVNANNCSESEDTANHVSSIAAWAQTAGKATGFITTVTVTHATPAGLYANTANRFWECDADIPAWGEHNDPSQCTDIAQQLITQEPGRNFDLVMGGGMGKFLPKHLQDLHGNMGERLDGKNLLNVWQDMHPGGAIVHDLQSLQGLNLSEVSHVMGLFQSGYLDYHAVSDKDHQPTLSQMTEDSIEFLKRKSDNGFFLLVEGGRIDTANHENLAAISIDETIEMEKAAQKVIDLTDPDETLIVVTADHSHPLSMAGYPERGNNILGINQHDTDIYGLKYSTLNYATGGNQYLNDDGSRMDIQHIFGEDLLAQYPSYIDTGLGVHAGDDVPIYSSGPQSHLLQGVMEQHFIPHFMAYAACIGKERSFCEDNDYQ